MPGRGSRPSGRDCELLHVSSDKGRCAALAIVSTRAETRTTTDGSTFLKPSNFGR